MCRASIPSWSGDDDEFTKFSSMTLSDMRRQALELRGKQFHEFEVPTSPDHLFITGFIEAAEAKEAQEIAALSVATVEEIEAGHYLFPYRVRSSVN